MLSFLTPSFHVLGGGVHSVREGTGDAEFREQRHTTRSLKLGGGPGQMRPDTRERDLRSVRLKHDQITFQLPQRETAFLTKAPVQRGRERVR